MSDTELILIRHGQANNTAFNEEDYDRLSDLGHEQARHLGNHLHDIGLEYARIFCGTLRRHRETAQGLNPIHEIVYDERLNEMRYFDMVAEHERQTGMKQPNGHAGFAQHAPIILEAWEAGKFDHIHVPYADFVARFADAMDDATALGGRSLFVTSGGVIGAALGRHLNLTARDSAKMMMPIRNTSMHVFHHTYDALHLVTYNATPHVDHTDRQHARTFF